jgi:hypothetical protein
LFSPNVNGGALAPDKPWYFAFREDETLAADDDEEGDEDDVVMLKPSLLLAPLSPVALLVPFTKALLLPPALPIGATGTAERGTSMLAAVGGVRLKEGLSGCLSSRDVEKVLANARVSSSE